MLRLVRPVLVALVLVIAGIWLLGWAQGHLFLDRLVGSSGTSCGVVHEATPPGQLIRAN